MHSLTFLSMLTEQHRLLHIFYLNLQRQQRNAHGSTESSKQRLQNISKLRYVIVWFGKDRWAMVTLITVICYDSSHFLMVQSNSFLCLSRLNIICSYWKDVTIQNVDTFKIMFQVNLKITCHKNRSNAEAQSLLSFCSCIIKTKNITCKKCMHWLCVLRFVLKEKWEIELMHICTHEWTEDWIFFMFFFGQLV